MSEREGPIPWKTEWVRFDEPGGEADAVIANNLAAQAEATRAIAEALEVLPAIHTSLGALVEVLEKPEAPASTACLWHGQEILTSEGIHLTYDEELKGVHIKGLPKPLMLSKAEIRLLDESKAVIDADGTPTLAHMRMLLAIIDRLTGGAA